jgi:hypothetical protein
MKDQVIVLKRTIDHKPIFQIVVNDVVLPATWLQIGPAEAAIPVERARMEKRLAKPGMS